MTSPVIDEDVMLDALKAAPVEELPRHIKRLRTGATLLLLDAYDRKLTRDQFIAAIGAAVGLVDSLARFEAMLQVKDFEIMMGRVTKADIEVTLSAAEKVIATNTDQCSKMATLIHECSLNEDKVH